jgi:hypothetical protein
MELLTKRNIGGKHAARGRLFGKGTLVETYKVFSRREKFFVDLASAQFSISEIN